MTIVVVPVCTICANQILDVPPGTILNFAICIICEKYDMCVYINGGRIYTPREVR